MTFAEIIVAVSNPPRLYFSREAARLSSDAELRRLSRRGLMVRLAAGVFIAAEEWDLLDSDARYRAVVSAVAQRSAHPAVTSHESAAALWRLPTIGPWSQRVHQLAPPGTDSATQVRVTRHRGAVDLRATVIDDVRVTSLERTAVDVARTLPFVRSVPMLDAALRAARRGDPRWGWAVDHTSPEAVVALLDELGPAHGDARARRSIAFADGDAGSAAESLCRVQFHALGYPSPVLQYELTDDQGSIGFADFYWPEIGLAVEFDGRSKYGAERLYDKSRSTLDVLLREKEREDRARDVVRSFTRLGWTHAVDRRRIAAKLGRFGLTASTATLSRTTALELGIR